MTKEQAKEILWNRCQHTPETEAAIRVLSEERPQGDLISREALKEEVVKLCERINANNGITVPTLAFTRIIDNAPTVSPYKAIHDELHKGEEE